MKGQRRRLHNARRVGKKTEKTKFINAEVKVHFYKMKTNKISVFRLWNCSVTMSKKHQKNVKKKRKYKMWPLEHNSVAHGEVGWQARHRLQARL